jgi:hypothetical protein
MFLDDVGTMRFTAAGAHLLLLCLQFANFLHTRYFVRPQTLT